MLKKLLLLLTFLTITACGDLADKQATAILYPYEKVNKKFPVGPNSPDGIKQTMIDGKIHAYYGGEGPRVVVYLHGNGENLKTLALSNTYGALAYYGSFVAIDYPGYGRSKGVPNEKTMVASGVKAVELARSLYPGKPVVLWGWSLGAVTAAQVAAVTKPAALVLISPWNNTKSLIYNRTSRAKKVSEKWYSQNYYDSVAAAKQFDFPTLVVIAGADKSVPHKNTLPVLKAIDEDYANYLEVPGMTHNRVYTSDIFWDGLDKFINSEVLVVWYQIHEYFMARRSTNSAKR